MIHDLNTPLSSILTNAEYLRDEAPASLHDAVVDVAAAAAQLQRMAANLSDLIEGLPPLTLANIALASLFGGLGVDADAHGTSVRADERLLRRVLQTLVDNSLHHAPQDTPVVVAAERVRRAVQIIVADAGKAIPERYRDAVFTESAYTNRDIARQARVGLGFGLWFCRVAVEAMGGRIEVGDTPGHSFVVTLPAG